MKPLDKLTAIAYYVDIPGSLVGVVRAGALTFPRAWNLEDESMSLLNNTRSAPSSARVYRATVGILPRGWRFVESDAIETETRDFSSWEDAAAFARAAAPTGKYARSFGGVREAHDRINDNHWSWIRDGLGKYDSFFAAVDLIEPAIMSQVNDTPKITYSADVQRLSYRGSSDILKTPVEHARVWDLETLDAVDSWFAGVEGMDGLRLDTAKTFVDGRASWTSAAYKRGGTVYRVYVYKYEQVIDTRTDDDIRESTARGWAEFVALGESIGADLFGGVANEQQAVILDQIPAEEEEVVAAPQPTTEPEYIVSCSSCSVRIDGRYIYAEDGMCDDCRAGEHDAMHCPTCGNGLDADADTPHGYCTSCQPIACTVRPSVHPWRIDGPHAWSVFLSGRGETHAYTVTEEDGRYYQDHKIIGGTLNDAVDTLKERYAREMSTPPDVGRIERRPDGEYDAFLPGMWCSIGLFDSRAAAAQALATYETAGA